MARWSWLILAFYVVLAVSAQDFASTNAPVNSGPVAPVTVAVDSQKLKKNETTTPAAVQPSKTTATATDKTVQDDAPTTPPDTTTTTSTPTTTAAPTTTPTTAAPPTTPPPIPNWPKNNGNWNITDPSATNVSCLIIAASFEVNLKYTTDKNTTAIANVLVPPYAKISGNCGKAVIEANLEWNVTIANQTGPRTNSLSLTFTKYNTTQAKESYGLTEIELSVFNDESGKQVVQKVSNKTLFQTPLSQSYKCSKDTPVKISDDVELRVSNLQLEAFRATPFDKFSAELECSGDDVSAVVPFAVGASLACLVVIVLIAYLIGRRRSRARGYQSV